MMEAKANHLIIDRRFGGGRRESGDVQTGTPHRSLLLSVWLLSNLALLTPSRTRTSQCDIVKQTPITTSLSSHSS